VQEVLATHYPTPDWQGLAIDGKTQRGSRDTSAGAPALQVLNAMVHRLETFIHSQAIPADTNELGAIRSFLSDMILRGRVVTLDALYTRSDPAQVVLDQDGQYLMRIKANQPRLLDDLQTWFNDPSPFSQADSVIYRTAMKGHSRLVSYTLCTTQALNAYLRDELGWPQVGQVFLIERKVVRILTGEITTATHYGITSLDFDQADPATLFDLWHRHWEVENRGHWVLDVVLGEDASRARTAHLPETLSLLRRATISFLRPFSQHGISATRSRLGASVAQALSLLGVPLDSH
jgi:predicted transposase YbfD/YdcC